jgi:penicillin-binding protein 1A
MRGSFRLAALLLALVAAAAATLLLFLRLTIIPDLPSVESIHELKLQVPLRIYTRDGKLIGEFGAERRAPVKYAELPKPLIQAFVAAEDERFFEHPGVDWQGLLRATVKLATTGEKAQGGSTITMQLARNVFLSSEKTYSRKLREILLAIRIEDELTKEQILEIYLNKIYLGNRAYGVGAAAQVYFNKDVQALTLAQIATIAGLPKAPSRDNPVANPVRAQERRNYVLRRMFELGNITEAELQAALAESLMSQLVATPVETEAHYLAEMVRADIVSRYGDGAYVDGYVVITTLDAARQSAANSALRSGLLEYEERHGWNGPEGRLSPAALAQLTEREPDQLHAELDERPQWAALPAAAVVELKPASLRVRTREFGFVEIAREDFAWVNLGGKKTLSPGDLVRVWRGPKSWRLAQVPEVQGALVALDPRDGAVQALVGGYDFFAGKFNRVMQARRQAGSGYKPFLYAAALAQGFTPASVFLDAPVVYEDSELGGSWRPENYDGEFKGPMRLREALVQSRNLVSVRVLQAIGFDPALSFAERLGLPRARLPRDLTLALGTAALTPMEIANAYAVLANGGFRVEPYFIDEIRSASGETLFKAAPATACLECEAPPSITTVNSGDPAASTDPVAATTDAPPAPRVVDARTIYLIDSMLHDVTVRGTGEKARELGRNDLAGKTGTTNDETDAWFNGFTPRLVAITWVGYDQPKPLGRGEVGGRMALPIWMDFMRVALKGVPETFLPRPPGIVNVRIDRSTGQLASAGDPDAIDEIMQNDRIPGAGSVPSGGGAGGDETVPAPASEDLF